MTGSEGSHLPLAKASPKPVAAETHELEGPSEHAVRLARTWLVVAGWGWLLVGVVMVYASGFASWWAPLTLLTLAISHFAVARFGSRRVAVFFVLFGP
jgi:hypothetical protein